MEQVLQRSNLVMPTCYVELDREEMSYVEGGGFLDFCENVLAGLVATVLFELGQKFITKALIMSVWSACQTACTAIWSAICSAAAFVWNSPVCMAILGCAVGLAAGITIGLLC